MTTIKLMYGVDVLHGLKKIKDGSVQTCVTSPPYWGLRDYGHEGQLGLESSPEDFVNSIVAIFREVRRVLRDDGTLWINFGDSYSGAAGGFQGKNGQRASRTFTAKMKMDKRGEQLKPKDLVGIPWRVAFGLQNDGWYLRQDIIWAKPNPMPESVRDRCTKSHEYIFLLSKSKTYFYNQDAIREPLKDASIARLSQPNLDNQLGSAVSTGGTKTRMKAVAKSWHDHKDDLQRGNRISEKFSNPLGSNRKSVWTIPTSPYKEAHFATFPKEIPRLCILAGSPPGGIVLDPFSGSCTTGEVALNLGRGYIGIELNASYMRLAKKRIGIFAEMDSE